MANERIKKINHSVSEKQGIDAGYSKEKLKCNRERTGSLLSGICMEFHCMRPPMKNILM